MVMGYPRRAQEAEAQARLLAHRMDQRLALLAMAQNKVQHMVSSAAENMAENTAWQARTGVVALTEAVS